MIEQDLIRAYLEHEELTQRTAKALRALDEAKNAFHRTYSVGCYVVEDLERVKGGLSIPSYVVEVDVWDEERVAPVRIKPLKPLEPLRKDDF